MKIAAFIPAKAHSNRLAGKNGRHLHGVPLFSYACHAALQCPHINRVYVSTDDYTIARQAVNMGAIYVHRPSSLAKDPAEVIDVLHEFLASFSDELRSYSAILLLQPNIPEIWIPDLTQFCEEYITLSNLYNVRELLSVDDVLVFNGAMRMFDLKTYGQHPVSVYQAMYPHSPVLEVHCEEDLTQAAEVVPVSRAREIYPKVFPADNSYI